MIIRFLQLESLVQDLNVRSEVDSIFFWQLTINPGYQIRILQKKAPVPSFLSGKWPSSGDIFTQPPIRWNEHLGNHFSAS